MQYNVAQLLKEPIGSTRDYKLNEVFSDAERFADTAHGSLRLLRTHQGVLATADLEVEAGKVCGRCLREYPLYLNLRVEEEFFPMVDIKTGQRVNVPFGSEGARIDASHTLELTDVLRQCIITASPMKPLCQPDCAGLCQDCGVDLNLQECQCNTPEVDPRWKELAILLKHKEN